MKLIALRAASALAIAMPMPAVAQESAAQSAAAPAAARPRWEVNWGDNQCMLIRDSGGRGTRTFALRRVPGSSLLDLVTVDPDAPQSAAPSDRDLTIQLTPSGQRIEAQVIRAGRVPDGNMIMEIRATDTLMEPFAASTAMEVSAGERRYFQMSYPLPTNALSALRQCEEDALRRWGVDPALLSAARTRVRMTNASLINPGDYPVAAIVARQQGVSLIRLMIDARGRAEECAVVVTSGSAVLDQESCALTQRRGRFEPAISMDGRPMRSVYVLRVNWVLPE